MIIPVADSACVGACLHAAPERHVGSPPGVQLLWASQLPALLCHGASEQAAHQQCWDLHAGMPTSAELSKAHRFAPVITDGTARAASSHAQQPSQTWPWIHTVQLMQCLTGSSNCHVSLGSCQHVVVRQGQGKTALATTAALKSGGSKVHMPL